MIFLSYLDKIRKIDARACPKLQDCERVSMSVGGKSVNPKYRIPPPPFSPNPPSPLPPLSCPATFRRHVVPAAFYTLSKSSKAEEEEEEEKRNFRKKKEKRRRCRRK